jgi:hypothetical protein
VSIQVEGKPLVEVRRGVGPPRDDQALLVERHHVDAIRGQADACSVGLADATDKPSGPVDADETVTGVLRQGRDSFDPVIGKDHEILMTEDEPVCGSACLVPVWYEALRGLDWQDPYLHLSAALTLFVLIPAICLQRAFWGAKLTAWMILDCLDVAFNPTGSFKDRGMTMAISPVPARLDAVLAQLGL